MVSRLWGDEVTDMYATTSETATNALCVWPREAPFKHHNANEVDLVARLQAGDESAFREIVERYASKISRVAYGILRNLDDADEIAQEVFAKVYFSIQGFGGRGSLYGWIYRIALNECYGLLRKKRFKMVYSSESSDDTPDLRMEAIADRRPTPDRTAMQRDFINKLLARIPEDDRWLLISKEVEGFSLAELSEMTGLSENTIKVRLFRVRQSLVAAAARLRPRRCSSAGGAVESVGKISTAGPIASKVATGPSTTCES
jgi:RNA polymerase sigma-70 factor, ECF subfamily